MKSIGIITKNDYPDCKLNALEERPIRVTYALVIRLLINQSIIMLLFANWL